MKIFTSLITLSLIISIIKAFHFEIKAKKEHCYIEELFHSSVAVIKYRIWATTYQDNQFAFIELPDKDFLENIEITVYTEQGEILKTKSLEAAKGKFPFISPTDAYYKICVRSKAKHKNKNEQIFFKLRITSDNMDDPNIKEALKTTDIDPLHDNIRDIVKRGERLVNWQENELQEESNAANSQMSNMNFYYSVTVFQILIIIILGVYQIYSFRGFLIKQFNL